MGVRKITSTDSYVFFVDYLSDELKDLIREHLSSICYGSIRTDMGSPSFSFKSTAKHFVEIYNSYDAKKQKGLIGELLFHLILTSEPEYLSASAFYNLEERSFKKGFDLCLYNSNNHELWITEVKSGEIRRTQTDQSVAVINLARTAQRDLQRRLNDNNTMLWINAISHALLAIKENTTEKKEVLDILRIYLEQTETGTSFSQDKNVILVGVLFHDIAEPIDPSKIHDDHAARAQDSPFNKMITVAIQKNTYEAVFGFIESEANNE